MKKKLSLMCIGVLIVGMLSGCSNGAVNSTNKDNDLSVKISALEQENKSLKNDLDTANKKHIKELEIRHLLNKKSFEIIHAMENKDIETLKKHLSKETTCLNDKIIFENYEYSFSSVIKENRLNTYWHWEEENNLFHIGYSIMGIENGIASPLSGEEFEYCLENGEWKLVKIAEQ
ncbi:hypothetical protein CLTEP_27770 [Clostridium tepidiprofundi DSM 19306]|uniref:DUF4829 domain-containing protein n=1 Tax=Clostridium tepidiprofundi DSM 19306 TaxID=1121338 RepID=A0A151AK81_9CLOT|nr:hypothetical protein [Clostridium tepidiprofundi]KYH28021.1 hypothetical protein CLTEP_27770 [Clostridium tepidiprofundi DSM 19306]